MGEKWPSADVVYAELKDRVALQLAQVDALDGKANFVLGSAGLLTAGMAALRNAAEPPAGKAPERWCIFGWEASVMGFVNLFTVLAAVAFVAVVVCSYQAYKVRVYSIVPSPFEGAQLLIDVWLKREASDTKVMLSHRRMLEDLYNNEVQIRVKECWTTRSLKALLAEAWLVLTMAVLQSFV